MAGKIIRILFIVILFAVIKTTASAQETVTGNELSEITEKIKTSYNLEKLNECRIRLRAIEFSKLQNRTEQEQYAQAYKSLALAFRNHRYSRPGFDLYQKHLWLRDTLLSMDKKMRLAGIEKGFNLEHTKLLNEISLKENEKNTLMQEKSSLVSVKSKYRVWSIIFTLTSAAIFIYFLRKINQKYRDAKINKERNRKQILAISETAWKGQMSAGALNRISFLNKLVWEQTENGEHSLARVESEFKPVKETSALIKNIKDDISRIKQLAEITAKAIDKIIHDIPLLKPRVEESIEKAGKDSDSDDKE